MFNTGNCSVPLVASIDGNGNNGNGFGGDGWAWWIIILLIFGWGGNGFGFGGNGGANSPGLQGLATRADINEGFALNNLQSGITAIQQGICDSTYATNNAINGVNMGMMQGFNGVERGFCNLSAQLAQCCCDNREAIAQVRYDMATQACDTRQAIAMSTRDIVDSQSAGTRAVLEKLGQMEYNNLNDKYQAAIAENQNLKFQASQVAQNSFIAANQEAQTAELIRRISPTPVPSYNVPAPYPYGCGYNNGCCNC